MITQEQVKQLFDYDENGYFVRKSNKKIAGSIDNKNYFRLTICQKSYQLHRVIWLWHYGELPTNDVDHIDGNPSNNKIENLRLATRSENLGNTKIQKNNTTGFKGVSFYKRTCKFQSRIQKNKKLVHLGFFDTPEEAHEAYKQAAIKHFGEFARY